MAVRHRLVRKPPAAVWAVLADPAQYEKWVPGPSGTRALEGTWPQVGAVLEYRVQLGPWSGGGLTVVRRCEPLALLDLEADGGPLGTARIRLETLPWGEDCLVTIDEHPLRGPGGTLHNTFVDSVLQLRHRSLLKQLAETVDACDRNVRAQPTP